jgi:hypothetical protein
MTDEQFARWNSFARRMALRAFPGIKTKRWLCMQVSEFLSRQRWNDAQERHFVPEGDRSLQRIRGWDQTDATTELDTHGRPKDIGPFVCDQVDEFFQDVNPWYWHNDDDPRFRRWDDRHGTRIRCCLRAGLDMACEPSTGVVGFTVGDLRRMYPRGIPAWIAQFESAEGKHVDLNVEPEDMGVWL